MNKELTVNRVGLKCDPFARFGDGHLIKLVLEAVDSVDAFAPVSNRPDVNSPQIVTLLTYCYARGIYSSEEIEMRLPNDKAIAYICTGVKPDWHLLRRFRRQHAALLIEALTQLIKLVTPLDALVGDESMARWAQFHDEARRLLRLAVQADSIAMDA